MLSIAGRSMSKVLCCRRYFYQRHLRVQIRTIIADSQPVVRTGLRSLLSSEPAFDLVGEAADGAEAVALATAAQPEIAILDIDLSGVGGLEAARQIRARSPATRVIFFTVHTTEKYLRECLKAGARGYLLKDAAEAEILEAIRAVRDGRAYLSPDVSRTVADGVVRGLADSSPPDEYDRLSVREREVLQLLVEGSCTKEIASALNLAVCTVESHRTSIFRKLKVHSIPQLILYAVRKGVVG